MRGPNVYGVGKSILAAAIVMGPKAGEKEERSPISERPPYPHEKERGYCTADPNCFD